VYCKETVGDTLADLKGEVMHLKVDSTRIPSKACNVIARTNAQSDKKVVLTAHIDAYEDTPGALDNASGVVALMLLAEMLRNYRGEIGVEFVAFNGEDHYSVGGQMDYLRRYGEELPNVLLNINIDDAGSKHGRTAYSLYESPQTLETKAERVFAQFVGLTRGEPWYQGDHMVFVQNQVPALAFTSENMAEMMRTVTHTARDTPEQIDYGKLVELAEALNAFIRSF
jgi:aminopeptidase YwaD